MKCEICGADLKLRSKHTGEKAGNRYWVCSRFPECNYRKMYAEQGKPLGAWRMIKGMFVKT